MKNKGIAVKCDTIAEKQVVSDFGRNKGKESLFTVTNLWAENVVVEGAFPGCHTMNAENHYTIISYQDFERDYLKKEPTEYSDYYKCIEQYLNSGEEVGKIYKHRGSQIFYYDDLTSAVFSCSKSPKDILQYLIPATKEEYEAQFFVTAQKEKVNINTDFLFVPGKVYVGDFDSRRVIFKLSTPCLNDKCWLINASDDYYEQKGCCTGIHITFRDAAPNETTWLEACIKAGKTVKYEEALKPTPMKKIEDFKYPDVIHITSKEQWNKIYKHHKLQVYEPAYKYYLIGSLGFSEFPYNKENYNNYEFSDIIFPKESIDLIGRWVKCLKDSAWSCTVGNNNVKKDHYYQLGSFEKDVNNGDRGLYKLVGGNYCGRKEWGEDQEKWKEIDFELMPAYWGPKVKKPQENLVGRYLKALVDRPHGGSVKEGEYGLIIKIDLDGGTANFPSQSHYGFILHNDEKPPLYEIMPKGWSPEKTPEEKYIAACEPQDKEIQAGDWVKCIGESRQAIKAPHFSAGWKKDHVFKVTTITCENPSILWGGEGNNGVYNVPGHVRKALPHEIPVDKCTIEELKEVRKKCPFDDINGERIVYPLEGRGRTKEERVRAIYSYVCGVDPYNEYGEEKRVEINLIQPKKGGILDTQVNSTCSVGGNLIKPKKVVLF